jgi:hypothetical protein
MARVLASLVTSMLLTSVAMAQQPGPYAPPPQPYPPQPQPQPYPPQPQPYAPQPYAPQPYAYQPQPQVQLTAEEAELLNRGPIDDSAHIGGGVLALFFGFGVGQAVQGRYGDTGWIFTVGEVASVGLVIYGIGRMFDDCFDPDDQGCDEDATATPFVVGLLALSGFRIWEVVDAFTGPASHNRRYKDLQLRVHGYARPQWGIYSARTMDRQSSVMGLELKF